VVAGGGVFAPPSSAKGADDVGGPAYRPGLYFGGPFGDATPQAIEQFERGFAVFVKAWSVAEGLGPLASGTSCVACHRIPVPGGSGTDPSTFVRVDPRRSDAAGGASVPHSYVDPDSLLRSRDLGPLPRRKSPSLFGLALLELVPDDVILARADPDDADGDGVSGRANLVGGRVGRFGWKASEADLGRFIARAFVTEMGLTSVEFPGPSLGGAERSPEVSAEELASVLTYVRTLAPPPAGHSGERSARGAELFALTGCAECHVPSMPLRTAVEGGSSAESVEAFTDLLVHDMGPELADGVVEGSAKSREFRTAPLWGVWAAGPPYLHDGRAGSLEEAVRMHGGEAASAREKFQGLPPRDRAAIIEYLKAL